MLLGLHVALFFKNRTIWLTEATCRRSFCRAVLICTLKHGVASSTRWKHCETIINVSGLWGTSLLKVWCEWKSITYGAVGRYEATNMVSNSAWQLVVYGHSSTQALTARTNSFRQLHRSEIKGCGMSNEGGLSPASNLTILASATV